jgi:hypothetical protein
VLEPNLCIDHLFADISLPEIFFQEVFIRLNFLAKLIGLVGYTPGLFVNEVLRIVLVIS